MTQYSKYNIIYRLQKWIDTVAKGNHIYQVTASYINNIESAPTTIEVIPTGISTVSNSSITYDIYTLSGVCLKHQANTLKGLRRGVYIINGKKVIIK